jgi:hypothetical protein
MMVRADNTALVVSSYHAGRKGLAVFLNIDLVGEAVNQKSALVSFETFSVI